MLIINSIERIKVKWYQSGFFKMIIMVVSLVIAAWSGQAWLAALGKAAATGAAAVAVLLLGTVLGAIALDFAMDWIIKEFGEKLGILGAIILTIAAAVISKGAGTFGNVSSMMMKTSGYMMQISSALISSTNEFLIEKAEGIVNEYDSFVEKMDGLWEELEITQDLAAMKGDLDPLTFTRPARFNAIPNEKPNVFFARCLGMQDNTMFTIHDEIHNFFDAKLKLDTTFA
jgi:hypothetical protein